MNMKLLTLIAVMFVANAYFLAPTGFFWTASVIIFAIYAACFVVNSANSYFSLDKDQDELDEDFISFDDVPNRFRDNTPVDNAKSVVNSDPR